MEIYWDKYKVQSVNSEKQLQLTLEYGFELYGSTYANFLNKYIGNFLETCDNIKKHFFSLALLQKYSL